MSLPDRYLLIQSFASTNISAISEVLDQEQQLIAIARVIQLRSGESHIPILSQIKHLSQLSQKSPYLADYYDAVYDANLSEILITSEYCSNNSILDLIKEAGRCLKEDETALIANVLLQAMSFLDENHLCAQQIKPSNIFVADDERVMLGDFGYLLEMLGTFSSYRPSPYNCSPEFLSDNKIHLPGDIWSLGITVFELLTGFNPYAHINELRAQILIPLEPAPELKQISFSPVDGTPFSQHCLDFVASMLNKDWERRPSLQQLLAHPFLHKQASLKDLIHARFTGRVSLEEPPSYSVKCVSTRPSLELVARPSNAPVRRIEDLGKQFGMGKGKDLDAKTGLLRSSSDDARRKDQKQKCAAM